MMDIGCFIGHDLRQLVFDGAPSGKLYAVDVANHWDVGYEMFKDEGRFAAHYLEADLMKPNTKLLELKGQIDIISITHVLHQWNWAGQVAAAKNLCMLSRPGSVVVGFQVGSTDYTHQAGVRSNPGESDEAQPYLHSEESLREFWAQVGKETGTTWEPQSQLLTWEQVGWDPKRQAYLGEAARIIQFVVTRTT